MAYSKGIIVTTRYGSTRRAILSLDDSNIANSWYLSDYSLSKVQSLVDELTVLVANPNGYLYWGQPQIAITSSSDTSNCFDEMEQVLLPTVPTQDLLNLMIEIRDFKQVYENLSSLRNIIGQAFTIIKSDPNSHKKYPNSDIDFATVINGMEVILVLIQDDFDLSESEYTNQVQLD